MSKILISLVSEQTIPNVLFIKEVQNKYKEEEIQYLFVSTDIMENKKKTDLVLKGSHIDGSKENVTVINVIEDSITDIYSKLSEQAKNWSDADEIIVNLTGGTKIMSIGVYVFFKEQNSYNLHIYYLPIGKNTYKQIFPSEEKMDNELKFRISLDDYLASYGVTIEHRSKPLKDIQYTQYYFNFFLDDKKNNWKVVNEKLREKRAQGKEIHSLDDLDKETKHFLNVCNFTPEKPDVISKNEINYLTGGWFEEYMYDLVKKYTDLDDDKIALGINISHKENQNEFDVMFVNENALYIFECKTILKSNNYNLLNDTLYKLASLKKEFGLEVKGYVATLDKDLRDKQDKINECYIKRANSLNIEILDRLILTNEEEINKIFDKIRGGKKNLQKN